MRINFLKKEEQDMDFLFFIKSTPFVDFKNFYSYQITTFINLHY